MFRDDGIQARDVSQRPGFFFVDLCHVVTDDLDLHAGVIRLEGSTGAVGTYAFLYTIRLEGSKPNEVPCESVENYQLCVAPTICDQLAL